MFFCKKKDVYNLKINLFNIWYIIIKYKDNKYYYYYGKKRTFNN